MHIFERITNPLERRRVNRGYTQKKMSDLLGLTQSQYSRIEKGKTNANKHLKKLSEIFECEPNEVFQGEILKEIDDDFINDETNSFQRSFHERKKGFVYLKIDGWFTKKQIIENYKMLLNELDEWKVNEDGIRWKHKG